MSQSQWLIKCLTGYLKRNVISQTKSFISKKMPPQSFSKQLPFLVIKAKRLKSYKNIQAEKTKDFQKVRKNLHLIKFRKMRKYECKEANTFTSK